ncbi:hypothetical protein GUJ93_ZPchr0011g27852 [Zizania palustris]|uniref:Uncharacterized protein n=1 Tax=Zizania palustris TaxID=103762 RepID=A0A8J5WGM3_ZIZPA|nr:hypothetical protein GUJ93_ZPchr0011g27852 [Zizania palustris]
MELQESHGLMEEHGCGKIRGRRWSAEGDVASCSGGSSSGNRALLGYACQGVADTSSSRVALLGNDCSFILGLSSMSQGGLALLSKMLSNNSALLSSAVSGSGEGRSVHECCTAEQAHRRSTAGAGAQGRAAEG